MVDFAQQLVAKLPVCFYRFALAVAEALDLATVPVETYLESAETLLGSVSPAEHPMLVRACV